MKWPRMEGDEIMQLCGTVEVNNALKVVCVAWFLVIKNIGPRGRWSHWNPIGHVGVLKHFNCAIYQQVDLAPAVGADLEVMNRDAKKRLVISGWVDTQKITWTPQAIHDFTGTANYVIQL